MLIRSYNTKNPQEEIELVTINKLGTEFLMYENLNNSLISAKMDPTSLWSERASNDRDSLNVLAKLALEFICVPVTEVTAERLFSFLNYIFSKLRSCLKSDIIENILFCRWNQKFSKI